MPLAGRRILVAEDLYLVAMMVAEKVAQTRAEIIGPYPSCSDCFAAIDEQEIDAAILDIGLADGHVFPVATRLADREIPFLFVTGYPEDFVPREFADAPCLLKPVDLDELCRRIAELLKERPSPSYSGASGSL
jgi:DNA-binding response OmpR family regulator